jgi:CRISPR-associated protein Csd2
MNPIQNRYEFVWLFDIADGNPNGDPDAGNMPRVDSETGHGLVTDVCLKRKIRNYVGLVKGEEPPYEIYVKEKAILNNQHERAYKHYEMKPESKKLPKDKEDEKKITGWMCQNFFDIRTFGAVMTTEVNAGQVRGPVQISFARSIDPIVSSQHTITRMAVTTDAESDKQQGGNRTMGRKYTIPYGLYRVHGYISAPLAEKTGFSDDDLELFWEALKCAFEHDRSAARTNMTTRAIWIFRHESKLGNTCADALFKTIRIERKSSDHPPRAFEDYDIFEEDPPNGTQRIKK